MSATFRIVLLVCFMRSPLVSSATVPVSGPRDFTVDPWFQQQELTAADGARGDVFGYAVAVSGNTAIIGAAYKNSYQGAAYVFNLSAAAVAVSRASPIPSSTTLMSTCAVYACRLHDRRLARHMLVVSHRSGS